jgi:hypothetical protein
MKNEMKNLLPQELMVVARITQSMMLILNARLFTLLGMGLCAAAFGWTLWQPDWIRAFGACAFAVLVYWPAVRMEAKRIAQTTEGESP